MIRVSVRACRGLLTSAVIVLAVFLVFAMPLRAQNDLATLSGTVKDTKAYLLPNTRVTIVKTSTNERRHAVAGQNGTFIVPGLTPGNYEVRTTTPGFSSMVIRDVVLHTAETRELQVTVKIGSASETVTVTSNDLLTTGSSVSTTIDSQFVQDIPLNGRSFQNLLLLTPGINQDSNDGGLVTNGMRSDQNYFTVDGISANVGSYRYNGGGTPPVAGQVYQALSGSTPTEGAFGGLQGVISLDSLDEFTVQSSGYSAAYGRQPGAQVQLTSKSGGNIFHGSAFDYLRNDAFNAQFTNPFTSSYNTGAQREREQDFGATLGGPLFKDKTFFFSNYEGVRGKYPANILGSSYSVPSLTLRGDANIPAGLRALLNIFPTQNLGPESFQCAKYAPPKYITCIGPQLPVGYTPWQGLGLSGRNSDNVGIKFDQVVTSHLKASLRYNRNASTSLALPLVFTDQSDVNIQTYTFKANYVFDNKRVNSLSASVSKTGGARDNELSILPGQGGVAPADASVTQALKPNSYYRVALGSYYAAFQVGRQVADLNRQLNLVDTFSWNAGRHLFAFGVDFRYTYPHVQPQPYAFTATFAYPWELDPALAAPGGAYEGYYNLERSYGQPAAAATTTATSTYAAQQDAITLIYKNLSLFAQDTFKVTPRLTLDLGVRWEYNAPLSSRGGDLIWATGWQTYSTMTLAPAGTPLYKTPLGEFAPRFGFSYAAHNQPGSETVLRGAFGIYYDTGQQVGGQAAQLYPHLHSSSYSYYNDKTGAARAYPYTVAALAIPSTSNPVNYSSVVGTIPNFSLPRIYQWNVAVQQAFSGKQTVTFTYVGNAGRRFLRTYTQSPFNEVLTPNPNLPGVSSLVSRNDGSFGDLSNYQGLQVQYQRQVAHGLQALVNYTWSHALDTNTTDYLPVENQSQNYLLNMPASSYGQSDNDRRHVLNIMFNYQVPHVSGMHLFGAGDEATPRFMRTALNGWALSGLSRAQSGGAFSVLYQKSLGPAFNYANYQYRANYNGGQVFVPRALGFGPKLFNTAAFTVPACALQADPTLACNGSTARNGFPNYGAWSQDVGVRRTFPIHDTITAEFRAEAFNILNHPNWAFGSSEIIAGVNEKGALTPYGSTPNASNAAAAAGNGALAVPANNQLGGPRTMQFALKVAF